METLTKHNFLSWKIIIKYFYQIWNNMSVSKLFIFGWISLTQVWICNFKHFVEAD